MEIFWQFATSVANDRVEKLVSYNSYENIIDLVMSSHQIIDYEKEPFLNPRLKGCSRASFLIEMLSSDIYDAFFNSPDGYRAQYARDKKLGEKYNRLIIDKISSLLIEYAKERIDETFEISKVSKSLLAQDAKIWIYEDEVSDQMGDDEPEILYEPWSKATEDGAGLRAPVGFPPVSG